MDQLNFVTNYGGIWAADLQAEIPQVEENRKMDTDVVASPSATVTHTNTSSPITSPKRTILDEVRAKHSANHTETKGRSNSNGRDSVLATIEVFLARNSVKPRSYQLEEIPMEFKTQFMISASPVFVAPRKYCFAPNIDIGIKSESNKPPKMTAQQSTGNTKHNSPKVPIIVCESPLFDEYNHFVHSLDQDWHATCLDIILCLDDVLAIKNILRPIYEQICDVFTAYTTQQESTDDWNPLVMSWPVALQFFHKMEVPEIEATHLLRTCSASVSKGFDKSLAILWGDTSSSRVDTTNFSFRRSMFLEALVRLSFKKYGRSSSFASQAIQRLIVDHDLLSTIVSSSSYISDLMLLAMKKPAAAMSGGNQTISISSVGDLPDHSANNNHRKEHFYTKATEQCFQKNKLQLRRVFQQFSKLRKVDISEEALVFKTACSGWCPASPQDRASFLLSHVQSFECHVMSFTEVQHMLANVELRVKVGSSDVVVLAVV